jgi:uncharacterized protein (DUF1684 family)
MKKLFTCIFFCTTLFYGHAQDIYKDSLNSHIARYIKNHEVVTGDDKQFFSFFTINEKYKVTASVEETGNSKWFSMETSGAIKKTFRVYGVLHFSINDTAVTLNIYQSQNLMNIAEYKNHLFLPFTDITSGEETYAAGRYIDLDISDIKNNKLVIDFNKAYNPYCAYVSGKYNCPIPPKENQLPVAILAGEKIFSKQH